MDNHRPEEIYMPDMAEEIDAPAEVLAEAAGIGVAEAKRVLNVLPKHPLLIQKILLTHNREWQWIIAAPVVADVIRFLILECRNLKAKVWGLVFSFGLADIANGNADDGIGNMTDEAKRQGVSRALMSNYKREWDKLFNRYGRVFGKSPEACENNRKARFRVLAGQRKAA